MNLTPLAAYYWKLAKRHRLPNALGRALYMTSRRLNEGRSYDDQVDLARMRAAKPETAERWLCHWIDGGSPKSLGRMRCTR